VAFDKIFPIARELARQKALRVIGCCGLAPDDRDDVASQLVATFYSRFGKFDGGRASVRTFASRVMDKELASILRYRMAVRRKHGVEESFPDDAREMIDGITDQMTCPRPPRSTALPPTSPRSCGPPNLSASACW